MAKILIVYATRQGHTAKVAQRVANTLRSHGGVPELVDADHPNWPVDLAQFRAAFVCAPIHVGGYPRSIMRFAREHRTFLERVPSAFLSVGLAVASRTTDGRAKTLPIVERFVLRTGWRPRSVELVAGALPYSKYNFVIRFIMRRIAARAGGDVDTSRDYEYTDWQALDRFAAAFVVEASSSADPPLAQRGDCRGSRI